MSGDLERVVRAWTAAYTEEVAEFAPPDQVTIALLVDILGCQTTANKSTNPL